VEKIVRNFLYTLNVGRGKIWLFEKGILSEMADFSQTWSWRSAKLLNTIPYLMQAGGAHVR
jgi:hypothetical protein